MSDAIPFPSDVSPDAAADATSDRRWQLILGEDTASSSDLDARDRAMARSLQALYRGDERTGSSSDRHGGLRRSMPSVAGWLDDIRSYFPSSTVRLLQRDAIARLDLAAMLEQPELLDRLEPDVPLAAELLAIASALPDRARPTLRAIVRRVVEELERRLTPPVQQAVLGSRAAARRRRPRPAEIDWQRTIRANLRHYQPQYGTVVPETLVGKGRSRHSLREFVLCLDSSGSMATSAVYASVFASALARLSAVRLRLLAFDTSVVDLTAAIADPVEVLCSLRLGGGTDIAGALGFCRQEVRSPPDTLLVLVSDLYEGGDRQRLWQQVAALTSSGVRVVTLLALNDEGAPAYDRANAERFAELGVPCLACTPDAFPELMAAAIEGRNWDDWQVV